MAKQLTFLFYILTLFVETWFTDNAKKIKAGREHEGQPASPPLPPAQAWRPSPSPERHALSDFVSVLVVFVPLSIMADSFFFTNWLDLPPTPAGPGELGPSAIAVPVKFLVSVLALGVAFLGPVAVSVFLYIGLTSWIEKRAGDKRRAAGNPDAPVQGTGCFALVAAVVVWLLGYGHWLLSYAFYDAIGALRTQ